MTRALYTVPRQVCKRMPKRIFDTQVAVGYVLPLDSDRMSLERLIAHTVKIKLDKRHTMSNWSVRPLSPEQVRRCAACGGHPGSPELAGPPDGTV